MLLVFSDKAPGPLPAPTDSLRPAELKDQAASPQEET